MSTEDDKAKRKAAQQAERERRQAEREQRAKGQQEAREALARAGLTPMPPWPGQAEDEAMLYVMSELLKAREHLRDASHRMSEVSVEDRKKISTGREFQAIRRLADTLAQQVN